MGMSELVTIALQFPATVYGYGEMRCGDPGRAVPCDSRATTASGDAFDPYAVTAAVPAPANRIMRPHFVGILALNGTCVQVYVNDKKHERYVGSGGLDLSPAAWKALGYDPDKWHSAKIRRCK